MRALILCLLGVAALQGCAASSSGNPASVATQASTTGSSGDYIGGGDERGFGYAGGGLFHGGHFGR